MDLSKSYEVFNPNLCKEQIHIIGCGSVGATVAELLARYGLENFVLYDFDIVEPKNINNQIFTTKHIGKNKAAATAEIITDINPDAKGSIIVCEEGWVPGANLSGIVILAVDNIETRLEICKENKMNVFIKGIFDFRTRLHDAQHYGVNWVLSKEKKNFFETMNFTNAEAVAETPVSACGEILGVSHTVRLISTLGVINIINFIMDAKSIKRNIFTNTADLSCDVVTAI